MARARDAPGSEQVRRFEALYRANYEDLLTYALRRSPRPEAAADVVAETFLIAWRRFTDIPHGAARAWLFGVARRVLANDRRAVSRGIDLADRLRAELRHVEIEESSAEDGLRTAFASLPAADQELLRLVAWEELTADELAQTLGCSVNAVRIRLHRARRRLAPTVRVPPTASQPEAPIAEELLQMILETAKHPAARTPRARRWSLRRLAIAVPVTAAAVALAFVLTAMLPSGSPGGPAPAQALDIQNDGTFITIIVIDPLAELAQYQAELDAAGLDVELGLTPVDPQRVGRLIMMDEGAPGIEVIEAPGACTFEVCPVGFRVPVDFSSSARIYFGRPPVPGESVPA